MVKHVPRIFGGLIALFLLVVAGCVAWVAAIPRDISMLIPRVEAALNATGGDVQFSVANASIDWRRWQNFGRISISDVTLKLSDGKPFAHFPLVQVRIAPEALLLGTVAVDWVIIPEVDLVLTKMENRQLQLGLASSEERIPISNLYASNNASSAAPKLPFNHLLLENANIAIRDESGKTLLKTYDSEVALNQESNGFEAAVKLHFLYRDQKGSTQALVRYNTRLEEVSLAAKMINLPIGLICGALSDCGAVKGLRGAVSGKLSARLEQGALQEADMVLSGSRLRFNKPEWFAETLQFTKAAVSATISDGLSAVDVKAIDLQNEEVHITASARAHNSAEGWHIKGIAKQNNLRLKNLYKYWPVHLAPQARQWVKDSITQGQSPEAIASVTLTPEDLKAEVLPDSFLNATIQVRGASLQYLPKAPIVRGLDGVVSFTGTTMSADVGGGALLDASTVKQAKVHFPDLNHPNVPIRTQLKIDASAANASEILMHPAFVFEDALQLSPNTLKGRITSDLDLTFDTVTGSEGGSFNTDGIDYNITAALTGVGQPKIMGVYDVYDFTGSLKADTKALKLEGKASVGASPLALTVSQISGEDVHVSAKGTLTKDSLVALGLPERKEIGEGSIGVEAGFIVRKAGSVLESLALNLTQVALTVPDISWSKPQAVPSALSLKPAKGGEGRYTLSHTGGDLTVNGTLSLDKTTGELSSLSLSRVKSPNNDFSLEYSPSGDAMRVVLKGERFDNSAAFTAESEPGSEHSILANFPKLHLTLDMGELVLAKDHPIRALNGTLDCFAGPCVSGNIKGNVGEKGEFKTTITSGGTRNLVITSSDAGALLRAIDASDKVFGGTLNFKGDYHQDGLKGSLIITDFNVKQSQVLARLFSVASLSGLSNLLTGSGIDFSKLSAEVKHHKGLFTLTKGRASGTSIGYTTEGTVDTRTSTLNLKGVLVPAYMLNSIVGKIPLIGAIAGGEGEGLFSFTYTVRGTYADPDVMVNPLSGLTPGFLRGIFEGEATVPEAQFPKADKPTTLDPEKRQSAPARERR